MSGADHSNDSDGEDDDDLETSLANLEAGTIEALDIDVLRQTITFHVQTRWGPEPEQHVAVFADVASFYMIVGSGTKRYEWLRRRPVTVKKGIGEWTSAGYYPDGVGTVRIHAKPDSWESGWVVRNNTRPNFAIGIGGQQMLIEARLVRIDSKLYEVAFIENDSPDEG